MADESLDPIIVHHDQRVARTLSALEAIILIMCNKNLMGRGTVRIQLDEYLNPSLVIPLKVEDGMVWDEVLYNAKN